MKKIIGWLKRWRFRLRTRFWTWLMKPKPAPTPERETTVEDVRLAVMSCERAPLKDLPEGTPGGGYGIELYLRHAERLRGRLPSPEARAEADALIAPQRARAKR